MASKHRKPRQSQHRAGRAHLIYGFSIIGILAAGTFGVPAVIRWQSAPVAKSGPAPAFAGKAALPKGLARQAAGAQSAWATKDTEQQPLNPIKPASVKMSPEQWESLDELFVRELKQCWTRPSHTGPKGYIPKIKVEFGPNGTLLGQPTLINAAGDPASKAQAANAMKAVMDCKQLNVPAIFAPFYDEWRTRVIYFDPSILDSI